jgi:hypothetical protein
MYSRSAKGGEKGDPNRNPWLAKMHLYLIKLAKLPYKLYTETIPKLRSKEKCINITDK